LGVNLARLARKREQHYPLLAVGGENLFKALLKTFEGAELAPTPPGPPRHMRAL
jgi:hypothetical protein